MLLGMAILGIAGCSKPTEVASTTGEGKPGPAARDRDVTTRVRAALQGDDALASARIAVVTTKGDVRLAGVLDNQAQIDRALATARAVDGVIAIHDELKIKSE
jgi:hyperosmotically inducible protein